MFLSKNSSAIGLDIGSHSIKLTELLKKRKGYELMRFGIMNLAPETIVDGIIQNHSAVVDTIKRLLKAEKVSIKNVVTGISGESVVIKKINLPVMSDAELAESVMVEAEQYIPFDIDDVNLDFQIIKGEHDDKGYLPKKKKKAEDELEIDDKDKKEEQMDVLLVAAKKDLIEDRIQILKEAGLRPIVVDVDAFAIENEYELNYGVTTGEVVALIDIGASVTNINILEDGITSFTKDVYIGGITYNQQLQKELEVSYDLAEKLKYGIRIDGFNPDNIIPIIVSTTNTIANEINKSFEFFSTATNKVIDKVVISGGCAHIDGIERMLSERFGISVEIVNPFKNIIIDKKHFDLEYIKWAAPLAATSVGLAIRKFDDKY